MEGMPEWWHKRALAPGGQRPDREGNSHGSVSSRGFSVIAPCPGTLSHAVMAEREKLSGLDLPVAMLLPKRINLLHSQGVRAALGVCSQVGARTVPSTL